MKIRRARLEKSDPVGNIPLIDRECVAVRRTPPCVDPAGRNSLGIFLEIAAPPAQLTAGSAPLAFAQTV
jgi:hypothetical protein